ncbi:hypothetical protein Gocc_0380 [Gaiella occulta]|uniref:Uncharacterized protein n=1 Tax=Gaiella occulta TaxID=1002870 RepID=A0A7M2Z0Z9_9ACTN|nr:hypothetical protein [Gaiella occulta]RDI75961.1 hypothetical protein Gocc_0380 [Gaiella occulta]
MDADGRRDGRRAALVVLGAVVVSLVPWTVYLSLALPDEHLETNWALVWTGFDSALAALAIGTLAAVWRRSDATALLATALATALVCDAWFDVTTAAPGDELVVAALMAVLVELPAAAFSLRVALRAFAARPAAQAVSEKPPSTTRV